MGKDLHASDPWACPVGPAPASTLIEAPITSKNAKILKSEAMYCTHANQRTGSVNNTVTAKMKMVTWVRVSYVH